MPRPSALSRRPLSASALSRVILTVATLGVLCGCGVAAPVPTPTSTPTPIAAGDGVLRIGTLFPSTGNLKFLGPAQVAGVEAAIREINEAGGVLGVPVEVFHRDTSDASSSKAETSLADLVTKEVDVVIGPSSSTIAERITPLIVDAGIAMISPAATFPSLTGLDDDGYVFRTIPTYAHQGTLLGEVVSEDGPVDAAIVYLDDELGTSLHDAFAASIEAEGSALVAAEDFAAKQESFGSIIDSLEAAEPDVVVLATPGSAATETKALITALTAAKLGGSRLWLTSQNTADYSQALKSGMLKGAHGIIEGATPGKEFIATLKKSDPALKSYRYAMESYDATILAALAAIVGENDRGESVARTLQDVSSGGIKCLSLGECLDVLKTQSDIDYDGVSGPVNFTADGDIRPAYYALYTYNSENKYAFDRGTVGG